MAHYVTDLRWEWTKGNAEPGRIPLASDEIPQVTALLPGCYAGLSLDFVQPTPEALLGRATRLLSPHRSGPACADYALVSFELSGPGLNFQVPSQGWGTIDDHTCQNRLDYSTERMFVQHVERIDYGTSVNAGLNFQVVVLTLSDRLVDSLLGSSLGNELRAALGVERIPSSATVPLPAQIHAPLFDSISNRLSGSLRRLHAQSRLLDWLLHLARALLPTVPGPPKGDVGFDVVEVLHDELLRHPRDHASLEQLAQRYGLSGRTLNDRFKQRYGSSIFQFLAERRLEEAYAALVGTELPIKALAQELGFVDVSHFGRAFKARYGLPPAAVRRRT